MNVRAALVVLILAATFIVRPVTAPAADPHVRWEDVIGILQAGNVVGSGTGTAIGGGQPWSTTRGMAVVDLATGDIKFRVEGLVFAGGNAIGSPGAVTAVKGTLVCDANGSAGGGNSTLVDTPLVPLDPGGDAEFNGSLGALPAACFEPDIAFLIRTGSGLWIANGAVRRP